MTPSQIGLSVGCSMVVSTLISVVAAVAGQAAAVCFAIGIVLTAGCALVVRSGPS